MAEQDKPLLGQPHQTGWLWRLMGLFQRQSHPISLDADEPLDSDHISRDYVYDWWAKRFLLSTDRKERYRIFDEMDSFDLVSGVLDLYAEEATQRDYDRGVSVWIESRAQHMIEAGEACLRNIQVEDRIAPLARRMCKYGDAVQRLIYQTGKGVLAWRYANVSQVHRLEDKYNRLIGFREDGKTFRHKKRSVSWPWDYAHYRLLGKDEESTYGTSILDALFRPWRQVALSEDSMLMYRLRRAPDRNMIMVDVGNLEEHEAMEYVNSWRKSLRKHEFVDPASPAYKKQYNPLTPLEDVFFPVRGADSNTRVEPLSGAANVGEIYDLAYFRDKFFGAAKVPKAYMGFEGDINAKCFDLEVSIPCLDGKTRTLREIIDGYEQDGWLPWVYSWDQETGRIVPGEVEWAGVTKRDAEVVEVELDDGSKHVCTPDHRWFRLDGSETQAQDLEPGAQLLPLRREIRQSKSYNGYEKVYHPYAGYNNRAVSELTHLMVMRHTDPGYEARFESPNVHHKDHNKRNNDPRNLGAMEYLDHLREHTTSRFESLSEFRCENGVWNKGITKADDDPRVARLRQTTFVAKNCLVCAEPFTVPLVRKRKKFCSSSCAGKWGAKSRVKSGRVTVACRYCGEGVETTKSRVEAGRAKFCSRDCQKQARAKSRAGLIPATNHRVVAVRKLTARRDTGDITVRTHHNFFISDAGMGGVLVHNSTLMQQDVRFARTVKRVQRALLFGMRNVLDIHYTLLAGQGDEGKYDFSKKENSYIVQMSPISYLDEWERIELVQLRYQLVEAMGGLAQIMQLSPKVWAMYVLLNYAKLPEELVKKLIAKSPAQDGGAADGGLESYLTPKQRMEILTEHGPEVLQQIVAPLGSEGFCELSKSEMRQIAEAMHRSSGLRKVVGDLAEYHLEEMSLHQTDPSLLPPILPNRQLWEDNYEDDKEAKQLKEDLADIRGTLNEG